jgi:hypothetical protein
MGLDSLTQSYEAAAGQRKVRLSLDRMERRTPHEGGLRLVAVDDHHAFPAYATPPPSERIET